VTGKWRRLHNEVRYDLYPLPNISREIKSSRMRWAGHVACMGHRRVANRVLGREEVTGKWRRLHNEELYNLYPLPNISREIKSSRMRWTGHVACMGDRRCANRVLVGRPEGRRPLGRP